jgi:hypothetical protein
VILAEVSYTAKGNFWLKSSFGYYNSDFHVVGANGLSDLKEIGWKSVWPVEQ